jgi:hypothetical protein
MNRIVEPELLDDLPATDPRAIQSRRDLRRINALMGNAQIIRRFLQKNSTLQNVTIAEIGAGDGNIAKQISNSSKLILIDRHPVSPDITQADIFEWLRSSPQVDVIIANLFLHHFSEKQLREMFRLISSACRCFAACEPRRSPFAIWISKRLNLIGCNEITRNDGVISVRAGFRDAELSALWPIDSNWRLTERPAGLFSHFFGAIRP